MQAGSDAQHTARQRPTTQRAPAQEGGRCRQDSQEAAQQLRADAAIHAACLVVYTCAVHTQTTREAARLSRTLAMHSSSHASCLEAMRSAPAWSGVSSRSAADGSAALNSCSGCWLEQHAMMLSPTAGAEEDAAALAPVHTVYSMPHETFLLLKSAVCDW